MVNKDVYILNMTLHSFIHQMRSHSNTMLSVPYIAGGALGASQVTEKPLSSGRKEREKADRTKRTKTRIVPAYI